MCLRVRKGTKIKIAKDNIVCYKVVRRISKIEVQSQHYDLIYRINVIYESEFRISEYKKFADSLDWKVFHEVSEEELDIYSFGFHSYTDILRAISVHPTSHMSRGTYIDKYAIAEFSIPRGAEYLESESEMYVSNKIIFKQVL